MRTVFRVAKNSIALMSGQLYGVVMNLLAISMIARYLPLETFGKYGFILAVCMTLSLLADMGINRIAIREIAREQDRVNEIKLLAVTVINKVILSAFSFSTIILVVWIVSASSETLLGATICAIATITKIIGDIPEAVFKAYERMKYNAFLKIIEDTSHILAVLFVITLDCGLNGIFMALLLSALIRLMFGIMILKRRFFLPRFQWDLKLTKWLLREAIPIGINRVFRKATLRIDTIILRLLRSNEEVGIFHGVYRIILIASIVPFNISESLFPIFARYAANSKDSLRTAFEKSFKFLIIIVLPIIFTLFMTSKYIILIILGEKFLMAVPLMQVLSLLLACRFFTILCTKVLNASNQQKMATRASGFALAVNVIMDVFLIYFYGYMGAAVATLVSDIVLFAISMIYVRNHVCLYGLGPAVARPLIFFAIASAMGVALKNIHLPLAVLLGLAIYIASLFIFKVFEDEELSVIRQGVEQLRIKFLKLGAVKTAAQMGKD